MQSIKQRVLAKANQLKKADTGTSSESLYQAIFEILDLEDRIKSLEDQPQSDPSYPINRDLGNITIEEWSDDEGRLRSIPPEADWIASISRQTNLDIRAILSPLPKELGLFEFKVVYVKQNVDGWENEAKEWVPSNGFDSTVHFATLKVWVVPVAK